MKSNIEINTNGFSVIPVGGECIAKIKRYAHLVGRSEIYGYLLNDKSAEDGVARMAYLAKGQKASGAGGQLDVDNFSLAKEEISDMGCKAIGFWHSHGSFGVFHSGIDDENMRYLSNSYGIQNCDRRYTGIKKGFRVENKGEQFVYSNGKKEFVIKPTNKTHVRINYPPEIPEVEKWKLRDGVMRRNNKVVMFFDDGIVTIIKNFGELKERCIPSDFKYKGAVYSIVTNHAGNIYSEMAVINGCTLCGDEEILTLKNTPVRVVDDFDGKLDDFKLIKDLEERVVGFRRKRLR